MYGWDTLRRMRHRPTPATRRGVRAGVRECQDRPGLVSRITVRWIATRPVRGS
jgi:hypothetical protein